MSFPAALPPGRALRLRSPKGALRLGMDLPAGGERLTHLAAVGRA